MIIADSASLWCFAVPTVGALGEASAKGMAKAGSASETSALGLAGESRLVVNVDKLTELVIIMSKEH
jgi:hypothetical protein